ncbi:hypothetical protein RRG08_046153 [Elysia crispata]|uniref:Uncharacterized protein n=1 Tax=Elysia crispata TaxID=231223 RepID=A0AAE1A6W1_9GAST|nr:hypothetical protein RRG08_046153 [Elysia crispata]
MESAFELQLFELKTEKSEVRLALHFIRYTYKCNKTVTSFVPSGQPLSCSDLFEVGPRTTVTCGGSATEYTLSFLSQ